MTRGNPNGYWRGRLLGVDFTSAPSRRKPITVARGSFVATRSVRLECVEACPDLPAFDALLREPGPWAGAFDFPFGLPRELVEQFGWPQRWPALIEHYASLERDAIRARFRAFCAARPAGGKFAHRATDRLAGSSPSMKWVNPPVAWMLHAGAPCLLRADVAVPGVHRGDPGRVALEGYPGLVARSLTRDSYKSDRRAAWTAARRAARERIVARLEQGLPVLDLRIELAPEMRSELLEDGSGDRLDAVLCLAQAAWAAARKHAGDVRWGLPATVDPLEGWIVTAGA